MTYQGRCIAVACACFAIAAGLVLGPTIVKRHWDALESDNERARDKITADAVKADRDFRARIKIVAALPKPPPESAAEKAARMAPIMARYHAQDRCRGAFYDKMAYLEPEGEFVVSGDQSSGYQFVVKVRLKDSFQAAPVGLVKCTVDATTNGVSLEKVRM